MFKKPFNRKQGETRECKYCGDTFHTFKPRWKCLKCINATQKEIQKRKSNAYIKKDLYPFDTRTNEAAARFLNIRTALSNAWKEFDRTGSKDAINKHYEKQLKEIEENGILAWILDRRTWTAKQENKIKKKDTIVKDYPSTKDMPYDI